MLALVNINRMSPVIGPIGLDYVAASARQAAVDVEILDLGLADEPATAMKEFFSARDCELVGLSFRNADDSFWPSADWFVPELKNAIETIRTLTDAPVVVGGVGFSIFARSIYEYTNADFGICGDGEAAIVELVKQLRRGREFAGVPGLIWRENNTIYENPPSWPDSVSMFPAPGASARDFVDNKAYFEKGGQCGLETKRGCNRNCIYCADPLAKGPALRLRKPAEIADEVQSLLNKGIDVLHLCDSEFNVPRNHAYSVCEEFNKRRLGEKIRWYAYMSPYSFDSELAREMARAGCAGIDFTGDSGCDSMLRSYRQRHSRDDLAAAVKLCRENNIAVMVDLLLGGPGETPQTVQETIEFIKKVNPDCVGTTLGMRVYPRTAMGKIVERQLRRKNSPAIRRKYDGPVDLLKPTFYISEALGENPAGLVRELIGGDLRFFEPLDEDALEKPQNEDASDYNYNENSLLAEAIEKGARGAYWHILHRLRSGRQS
ncbi:MAG: radical SAM protein [Sedimentisphaerales bacterium]|nr:radical SAM protein [Sedimentisphaerales bacterium]